MEELEAIEIIGFEDRFGERYLIAPHPERRDLFEMYSFVYRPSFKNKDVKKIKYEEDSIEETISNIKEYLEDYNVYDTTKLADLARFGAKIQLKVYRFTLNVSSRDI